jgi:hypothetical protein
MNSSHAVGVRVDDGPVLRVGLQAERARQPQEPSPGVRIHVRRDETPLQLLQGLGFLEIARFLGVLAQLSGDGVRGRRERTRQSSGLRGRLPRQEQPLQISTDLERETVVRIAQGPARPVHDQPIGPPRPEPVVLVAGDHDDDAHTPIITAQASR